MARDHIDDRDDFDDRDDRDSRGGSAAPDQPETDPFAPPTEPAFWHTYSARFECPISHVVAALLMVLAAFLFLLVKYWEDKPSGFVPPVQLGLVDGPDATGEGEAGSGGTVDPQILGSNEPTRDEIKNVLPDLDPSSLPKVKDDMTRKLDLDPDAIVPISDQKAAAYAAWDKKIQDKLMGVGQQKGDGTKGDKGEGGTGKGDGTGADSTRARTMRWIIRFKTAGGRDYLDQLQALGAKVLVPLADGKQAYIFRDLKGDPPAGKLMVESDWNELSGLVQFSDYTRLSCDQVGQALGMGRLTKGFWAFFPKDTEDKLAKMERGYQQRRAEDVEETTFEVVNRGGKYEFVVTGQKLKK